MTTRRTIESIRMIASSRSSSAEESGSISSGEGIIVDELLEGGVGVRELLKDKVEGEEDESVEGDGV